MLGKDCSAYNICDEYKKMKLEEVKELQENNSLPFAVAAVNINGDLNLGSMIRTSVIFGAEKFFIIGKKRYDKRSTVGAHNYINIQFIEEDVDEYPHLAFNDIVKDYEPHIIEQGGQNINNFSFSINNKIPPCVIFGSESNGFSETVINVAKDFNFKILSIPQYGVLRSLNVSSAASIVINKVATDLIQEKDSIWNFYR